MSRLVTMTYLPNPNNLPEVDHLNADKSDNVDQCYMQEKEGYRFNDYRKLNNNSEASRVANAKR